MGIFSRVSCLFLLLVFSQIITAETVTPQNFSFAATLNEGKQSLRQFELSYEILAGVTRQDYGDVRIFNSQNQPVPFAINQIEPQTYQNNDVYPLRFFRLSDNSTQRGGLQIEFSETSTRFSFNALNEGTQANYLLIENQHQNDELQAIKLEWQQPDETFSIKVRLESSDDLQSWQTVNDSVTLYDLKYADTALVQNTLSLPATSHAKYLRLSFQPSSSFSLQIDKISGEYQHTTSVERENSQDFQLQAGEHPNEWLFNTGSFIPVTKISFKIPAVGLFYRGSLYSKTMLPEEAQRHNAPNFRHEVKRALHHRPEYQNTEQNNWRYQGTVTQYRLLTAAGEIESEPISIAASKDQQWKLVLEQPATLLPEQVPSVKLSWHPVIVTFLAQGNSPYQLLFGNPAIESANEVLPPLANSGDVETVGVQEIRTIEQAVVIDEPEYIKTSENKISEQKVLLWLLLCVGVLVMAVMAYQLYLRMNQPKE